MKLGKNYTSLVIGDVGSGKTYVSIVSAFAYLKNSDCAKVSFIAPTEVLAFQHYCKIKESLELMKIDDIVLIYISSKLKYVNNKKVSKINIEDFSDKKILCVGTHSLFNLSSFNFNLIMVDEQHRFGVDQRGAFSNYPHHFISFTATPIPRTLALSLFSKLNTLFIEKLKGRTKVMTNVISFDRFFSSESLEQLNIDYISKNSKIYIVCPKIEEKESEDKVWSVNEIYNQIEEYFPNKVLKLTGNSANKKDILQEFKESKDKQILVSTSVIEVGVDVAEARVIVIVNAERFGLAGLHQLRGRVGRNNYDNNKCLLVVDKKYLRSHRLNFLTQNDDGFKIAEFDMSLRGTGDLAGVIQSGFTEEVDTVMKLNDEELINVKKILEMVNFNELPRLQNFINKKISDYHPE
jgi:ATP-dependent DNA helicase RecG